MDSQSAIVEKAEQPRNIKSVAHIANFMVFGQKKSIDPLEEFWMSKLSNVEKQYDEHMVHLEKSLLENRIRSRFVTKQKERMTLQKEEIEHRTKENEKLIKKTKNLEKKLEEQNYEKQSLKKKLVKNENLQEKTMKVVRDERYEKIRCQREISALKFKLGSLERDRKLLSHDITIKESERARVSDKAEALTKEKWNFIKKLSQVDVERRVQTTANITLCESIGQLLQVGRSQEDRLIQQKQELEDMLYAMEQKRKAHEEIFHKLRIKEKQVEDTNEKSVYATQKMEELNRQIKHWKEELNVKEVESSGTQSEMRKLKNENSYLRCQMAKLRGQLEKLQSEMVSLENHRRKTEVELATTKEHGKAIYNLMCRNRIIRDKLAEKIRTSESIFPDILKTEGPSKKFTKGDMDLNKKELASYKKKVWDLERQKNELERKVNESKRKENLFKIKLSKYATVENQILWTEKALMKLDGEQTRTQNFLKTVAGKVTKKMPFEKLVSDPSIMDRIIKHKVLQERLRKQSAKVEELKANAEKLLKYRDGRSSSERNRVQTEPQWKLSYWMNKRQSQEAASEQNDVLTPSPSQDLLEERDYYKDYIQYLDESVPLLKQQIFFMEKRQAQIVAKATAEEQRNRKKQQSDSMSDTDIGPDHPLLGTVEEEQDGFDEEEDETEYEGEEEDEESQAEQQNEQMGNDSDEKD